MTPEPFDRVHTAAPEGHPPCPPDPDGIVGYAEGMSNHLAHTSTQSLPDPAEHPTIPLWPDAGRALGLGRSGTYAAAARGDFPGLLRIGGTYRVATAKLRAVLGLDNEVGGSV